MAKRIVDEEMRFTVVINGNEAQKELIELENATRDLTNRNKELAEEQQKLRKLGLEESKRYQELTQEIKANERAIEKNQQQMEKLQNEIGITSLSMRQLNSRARSLRAQLHHMVPGSAEYKRLQADLDATTARVKELRASSVATRTSLGSIADGFNRYAALGASVIATGTGMVLSIQRMIDYNAELSDSQADVMKTTQMTKEEVDELTKSFGAFKTRSSRIELLKIAEEAGRLGITGVQNLKDFVAVANQIKVALGDDLTEEGIRDVGKMTEIFKVGEQTGKDFSGAMLALGSSINEVAAAGANNADFLVDFMKRTAGVSNVVDISVDKIIGLGAALDEVGARRETAGTSISKTLQAMYTNVEKFASIAGIGIKDFKDLLEKDANEALLVFAEGLEGTGISTEELISKLEGIDIGGQQSASTLLSLATATDKVRERQALARKGLEEATSVTNEYNVKNENLAATLSKIRKEMAGWFSSETIINGLDNFMTWFAKLIGATEDVDGGVTKFRNSLIFLAKLIIVVTAAMVTNVAWLRLTSLWTATAAKNSWLYTAAQKAHVIATEAAFVASQLYAAATMLLTGNIKGATQAIRVMSATLKTTPWGMVLGLVAAIGTAYYMYSKAEKDLNQVRKEVAKTVEQEKFRLEGLIKIAKNEEESKERRLKAIKKLNQISPEYLKNISLENINTEEATKSINSYVKALEKKALAQAIQTKQQEAINSLVEKNLDAEEEYEKRLNSVAEIAERRRQGNASYSRGLSAPALNIEEEKKRLEENAKNVFDAALEVNKKEYEEYITKLTGAIGGSVSMADMLTSGIEEDDQTPPFVPPKDSTKDENIASRKAELRKLKEENDRLQASLITDSFEKEMELEKINHQASIAQLKEQMIEKAEMAGMSPRAKQIALDKNQALRDQILIQEELHQNRKGSIIHKGLEEDFQQREQAYQREKVQRETAHNLALAALGNDEVAKKALQEKFDQEEKNREVKHLEDLKAEMQRIISAGNFEGFDLELLSPEEKQKVLDALDEIGLKLSEVINKKNSLQGNEGIDLGAAGGMDIFGFTADDWMKTFQDMDSLEDKLAGAAMAVGGLSNAYAMYQQFRAQAARRELEEFDAAQKQKENRLQRQLDAGLINQRQYSTAVRQLEKESEKERAKLEYESAKRQWNASMSQAIGGAAMAVLNGLQAKPFLPVGLAMGALAGVLGGLQVAMVAKSKPVKGFEKGLYPVKRQQDGKTFQAAYGGETRSGLVDRPTMFLAGEGGKKRPEMIIDDGAWAKMDPAVKDSIYNELGRMGRVPGFERGLYRGKSSEETNENTDSSQGDSLIIAALNRNSAILEKIEAEGVRAVMLRTLENAKKIQDDINDYNKLRNANKR